MLGWVAVALLVNLLMVLSFQTTVLWLDYGGMVFAQTGPPDDTPTLIPTATHTPTPTPTPSPTPTPTLTPPPTPTPPACVCVCPTWLSYIPLSWELNVLSKSPVRATLLSCIPVGVKGPAVLHSSTTTTLAPRLAACIAA